MTSKVEAQILTIKNGFLNIFEELEEIDKTWDNMEPKAKAEILGLTSEALSKLPWKPYKEGHRAGWIFSNVPEAQALVKALQTIGEVEIGEFTYTLSGEDGKFISRNPSK